MGNKAIFNISDTTINAAQSDDSDKIFRLESELKGKTSIIREIIDPLVPEGYDLDDRIDFEISSFEGLTGSINVKYTFRKYIGDQEYDYMPCDTDIYFEIFPDTFELELTGLEE